MPSLETRIRQPDGSWIVQGKRKSVEMIEAEKRWNEAFKPKQPQPERIDA